MYIKAKSVMGFAFNAFGGYMAEDISVIINKNRCEYKNEDGLPEDFESVKNFYSHMAEYEKTPLLHLSALAEKIGVKDILVKDESKRFSLNAFKGLGVSYALNCLMEKTKEKEYLFVSCTDGNHGRALAWRAKNLGCKCVIFMPGGSDERRVNAIKQFGADVRITGKNYMETVYEAEKYARENGGWLIQDTAFEGYDGFVPDRIVMGYSMLVRETLEQTDERPTHVFIQAGVGSAAGGVIWYIQKALKDEKMFTGVIEAEDTACIYESIRQGKNVAIGGMPYTVMAGLNCGEANIRIMPLLKSRGDGFIKCADSITYKGMERAINPVGNDPSFSGGESGAVGLGFIEEILTNEKYAREKSLMGIDENSVILLFNTEGRIENL